MSNWSRELRPTTFENILGNERVVMEFQVMLRNHNFPQQILLTGPRGVGKTTLERVIAKSLLCESGTGDACNECYTCLKMDEYILDGVIPTDVPLFDYNISKLNKVEDADAIVEQMKIRTFNNSPRVFIVDEIHAASYAAQTRYLGPAEEPLDNVYLIMGTTNPEKLIKPLKSRFLEYSIKRPPFDILFGRLKQICISNSVNYSDEGLKLLISKLNRIPREIFNRAEVIAANGDITKTTVMESLLIISDDTYMEFFRTLMNSNISNVATIVKELQDMDIEPRHFVDGLGQFLVKGLDILAMLEQDAMTLTEVKKVRKFMKELNDDEKIGLLLKVKDYLGMYTLEETQLYAFAVECMTMLKRKEILEESQEVTVELNESPVVPEVEEAIANKNYSKVTEKEAKSKIKTEVRQVAPEEILGIFNTAVEIPDL